MDGTKARGTVFVTGAGGFIGGHLVAALHAAGWHVLRGVRPRRGLAADERAVELGQMRRAEDWLPLLAGVDAVVNAAGILRERAGQSFEAVHHAAPLALAEACVAAGIERFVQVSALGDPADGAFIASKHRFDEALVALPLRALVLRPSVVYSTAGSYGGTSLLRALAGLPGVQLLPGKGDWRLQPLAAEDLAALVVRALERPVAGIHEVGGPEVLTLAGYQRAWRDWLGVPARCSWRVPEALVGAAVAVGERLGRGPLGATIWRMLRRGNITAPDALARLEAAFGFAPRSLAEVLAAQPSQVQDRWHAGLHFLAPPLRLGVVALFLLSALAGWRLAPAEIEALAAGSVLAGLQPVLLVRALALADLALGLWLLAGWRRRWAIGLMALGVLGYTLVLGLALPAAWLDPLGGLAKNLVLLPALAVLWVLAERR